MSNLIILLRLVVSALLSGFIGLERELHGCAAGLRTHILVCIGSTLFMLTSIYVAGDFVEMGNTDPSRIAAGVVTGIGFLGAGAIIRYGTSVRGLTTAASIWAVAAVGLAVGAGMYMAASIATFVALLVLILSRVEERMQLKRHSKKLRIKVTVAGGIGIGDIRNLIEAYGGSIKGISTEESADKKTKELVFNLMLARGYHKDIISEVASLAGVEDVYWK
ncbi:MAG: MgtC/SapB family protein [Candidatus Omnitrophota bacterium]